MKFENKKINNVSLHSSNSSELIEDISFFGNNKIYGKNKWGFQNIELFISLKYSTFSIKILMFFIYMKIKKYYFFILLG